MTNYVKEKKTFGEKKSFLEIGATHLIFTYSKLTTETLEKSAKYVQSLQQKHQNDVIAFIANFEHILHIFLVFLFLTLNK